MTRTSLELFGYEPRSGAIHFRDATVPLAFNDGVSTALVKLQCTSGQNRLYAAIRTVQPGLAQLKLLILDSGQLEIALPRLSLTTQELLGLSNIGTEWFGHEDLPDYKPQSAWHLVLETV